MGTSESTTPRHDPIVGIDLGTTNSLVAIWDDSGPHVLLDESGEAILPSVVRYSRSTDGSWDEVVGRAARHSGDETGRPSVTISSVKRLMGRSLDDATGDLPYLAYEVVRGEHNTARVALPSARNPERVVSPQEVSAAILRRLRDIASDRLGVRVRRAVVTVPAYFDDAQRQATRDAGRLAGLEVVRIVNEPTAAALAYGLSLDRSADRNTAEKSGANTVVVYDLGGGTFDVSVLELVPPMDSGPGSAPAREAYRVLSTAGDTHLGGDDFDQVIAGAVLQDAGLAPESLGADDRARVIAACERAKRDLSERSVTRIEVQLAKGPTINAEMSRARFDSLIGTLVDRTMHACRRALRDAGMLDERERPRSPEAGGPGVVVLVGGSTRVPLVRERVREYFGFEAYSAIDPDQVVALGAAVQGAILEGRHTGALLLDVIPLSLGLETAGGAVAKIIMRNSAVPARAAEMFSTSIDGQTSIKLNVLQGEREMAQDCRSLGEFHLRGIPPMPAGIPQVEVEFLVDSNGVLRVSARERRSDTRTSVQIVPNHGLSRDEIDRIERESLAHAKDDMRRHRVVDLVATSRLEIKWTRDRLDKLGAKVDSAYAGELRTLTDRLAALVDRADRDWQSVDPNELNAARQAMERASVRLHEIGVAEALRSMPPKK
ncbi:MAG: Hsp70 family protein [Phycisphaerales bacterium]|nr:MAG: Hsp70 family protein [Phycisphaerales bacterium]